MADATIKPDSGNDLVLSNDDGSAKIEVNENNIDWFNAEEYKKFIAYLLKNNLHLKAFNLCSHEAGATEEKKSKFAEILGETKNSDPNAATYTIKLNDESIATIRKFSFQN